MTRIRNSKFSGKKSVAFTEADFPTLPEVKESTAVNSSIKNWSSILTQDADRRDPTKHTNDEFHGDCDESGLPIYGKISFSNGNVYRGPIFTECPKFDEWELENEMSDDPIDYYFDPCDFYGEMIYSEGTSFYGQFCFEKRAILGLIKK